MRVDGLHLYKREVIFTTQLWEFPELQERNTRGKEPLQHKEKLLFISHIYKVLTSSAKQSSGS